MGRMQDDGCTGISTWCSGVDKKCAKPTAEKCN